MTTVKLIETERTGWSAQAREAEIAAWAARIAEPVFRAASDAEVAETVRACANAFGVATAAVGGAYGHLETRVAAAEARAAEADLRADAAEARAIVSAGEATLLRGSRSWRWTAAPRVAGRVARSRIGRRGR